jgi:hypothetical protein
MYNFSENCNQAPPQYPQNLSKTRNSLTLSQNPGKTMKFEVKFEYRSEPYIRTESEERKI